MKPEPTLKTRNSVPSSAIELGTRIAKAADSLGTRKIAADAMGVSTDSLARYIRGENEPTFKAIAGLCAASGFSMLWMHTGNDDPTVMQAAAFHGSPDDCVLTEAPVDKAADAKELQALAKIGDDLRRADAGLEEAQRTVGYQAPLLLREALRTAMYRGHLTPDGAATLLFFLRPVVDGLVDLRGTVGRSGTQSEGS